jgi:serine/threonine-protein kinase
VTRSELIFDGRYRLNERIAAGGVGQVWRARDLLLQRPVAIKVLRPEYADHPETLDRFQKEARHAGALSHPNVAQVYDYGRDRTEASPYLVMELVDGPSLADLLAADAVDSAFALDVIAQAADGLSAAHRIGLVHRDVKPGNILIGADGRVKITDFGIAHAAGQTPMTGPGVVMGTTQYMAPERIAGGPGSPSSDLYALGIVLYECLTGLPPYEGTIAEVMAAHLYQPLPPLPAGVPQELNILVARLTAKDPGERLGDAREVAGQAARLRDALLTGDRVLSARGAARPAELPPPAPGEGTAARVLLHAGPPGPQLTDASPVGRAPAEPAWAGPSFADSGSDNSNWSDPNWSGPRRADSSRADSGAEYGQRTSPPDAALPTRPARNGAVARAARRRRRRAGELAAGTALLAVVGVTGLLVSGALDSAPPAHKTTVGSTATGTPTLGSVPSADAGSGTGGTPGRGAAVPGATGTRSRAPRVASAPPASRPAATAPASVHSGPSPRPTSAATASAGTSAGTPATPAPSSPAASGATGSPRGTPTGTAPTPTATSSPAPSTPAASLPPITCWFLICI